MRDYSAKCVFVVAVLKLFNFSENYCTCVFGNIVQEKRVLSKPLHLSGNDILKLQTTTQWITLSILKLKANK